MHLIRCPQGDDKPTISTQSSKVACSFSFRSTQWRLATCHADFFLWPTTRRRGGQCCRRSSTRSQALRTSPVPVRRHRGSRRDTWPSLSTQCGSNCPASRPQRSSVPSTDTRGHPSHQRTGWTAPVKRKTTRRPHTDPVAEWALHDLGRDGH